MKLIRAKILLSLFFLLYFKSFEKKNVLYAILEKKSEEILKNALYVKTFISCLIPYPTPGLLDKSEIFDKDIENIVDKINL